MKRFFHGAIAAAGALVLAGAAAQPVGQREAAPPAAPETPAKPPVPPQSLVGRDVVNTQGQRIGTVKAVVGAQVIVSVADAGGGDADRDVALPWEKLTMTGAGDRLRLQTELTGEQLRALMRERRAGRGLATPRPVAGVF